MPSVPLAANLPLADKVVDETVCEGTDILEKIVLRMFEVLGRVTKFSCDYVMRGKLTISWVYWFRTLRWMMEESVGGSNGAHQRITSMR